MPNTTIFFKSSSPAMHLSAMLTSLPLELPAAARVAADLGFHWVDVVAESERVPADARLLADLGLRVSCASLARGLPSGAALDSADVAHRTVAVDLVRRHLDDAAALGATAGYVVPTTDSSADAVRRFGQSVEALADHAARLHVRVCLEHFPRRALPTVKASLAFIGRIGHPNFHLLIDIGHCQISKEPFPDSIRAASTARRLGYIHLDDNDGRDDLHRPLLKGVLTERALRDALRALSDVKYQGALALELNPKNPDPTAALREGRALVERLLGV